MSYHLFSSINLLDFFSFVCYYVFIYLCIDLNIDFFLFPLIYLSIHLCSYSLTHDLFIYLSIYLLTYLSIISY